jgi:hypothetical protein
LRPSHASGTNERMLLDLARSGSTSSEGLGKSVWALPAHAESGASRDSAPLNHRLGDCLEGQTRDLNNCRFSNWSQAFSTSHLRVMLQRVPT